MLYVPLFQGGFSFRFAFNVGNGLQVLEVTTAYWLNNNQWHVVRLERNRKESRLIVDTNPAKVLTEAQERSFLMFNFDQPLFVGTTQVSVASKKYALLQKVSNLN